MNKLITKDQTIELKKYNLRPKDVPANDIKIEGDEYTDLYNLNLNIVKYEISLIGEIDVINCIDIINCNINKLILDINGRAIRIFNSNIQNIYIQSKVVELFLRNSPLPKFHQRIDLINKIMVEQ